VRTQLEVVVETSSFSMDDAKKMKVSARDAKESSRDAWIKMEPEFQKAIVRSIKYGLEAMHTRANDWIPDCMIMGRGGDKVTVELNMVISDIESQILEELRVSDFEVENTKRKIQSFLSGNDSSSLSGYEFINYVRNNVESGTRITVEDTARMLELIESSSDT